MELTEALSDQVNIFAMALHTGGDNEALLGGDVVHHELLHDSSIDVADVVLESEAGHTEGLVTIGGAEEEILVVAEWVVLAQVVVEVVGLLVLGAGDVGSHDGSWLEGAVNHHLEHVSDVVFDAVALEISALLIVFHLHVTAGHLDHTVVDGLIGMLECLEVSVLQGEERAGSFKGLITSSHVHKET